MAGTIFVMKGIENPNYLLLDYVSSYVAPHLTLDKKAIDLICDVLSFWHKDVCDEQLDEDLESLKTYQTVGDARILLVRTFAWPFISNEHFIKIANKGPVIDVGAGTGYNAWCISQAGGDVIACERYSPSQDTEPNKWHYTGIKPYHPLFEDYKIWLEKEASRRILLLSWPPFTNDFGFEVLSHYLEYGGKEVIYIGEERGGCTGSEQMFNVLDSMTLYDEDYIGTEISYDRIYYYRR